MLLQTNSYIVPKDKKAEHARLIRRFRQTLNRLGCEHFEVYEQVGANWSNSESTGRYVQILRFNDRKHQLAVQQAERADPTAQAVIADFCDLINFPYQQQQGLFAVGFYTSVLPVAPRRDGRRELVPTVEHEVQEDDSLLGSDAGAEGEHPPKMQLSGAGGPDDSEFLDASEHGSPPLDAARTGETDEIDGEVVESHDEETMGELGDLEGGPGLDDLNDLEERNAAGHGKAER